MDGDDEDVLTVAKQREALVWQAAYYAIIVGIILGLVLVTYTIHYGPA